MHNGEQTNEVKMENKISCMIKLLYHNYLHENYVLLSYVMS